MTKITIEGFTPQPDERLVSVTTINDTTFIMTETTVAPTSSDAEKYTVSTSLILRHLTLRNHNFHNQLEAQIELSHRIMQELIK